MGTNGKMKVTGLWKNTLDDGRTWLGGNIGMMRVLVYPNSFKKTEKDPDYILYVTEREEKEATDGGL